MPVVINEFEVVAEPAAPAASTPAAEAPEPPRPGVTPREVEALLRRQAERLARLRAH